MGGKGKLLWLLNRLAPARYVRFVDVFGGSGTVTLGRPLRRGCVEIYNDFNSMSGILTRKTELIQAGHTGTEYDSRVQAITDTLEGTDSAIEGFNDGMVYQTVSSIKVLDKERLAVRFKDGTEIEQEVVNMRRASA